MRPSSVVSTTAQNALSVTENELIRIEKGTPGEHIDGIGKHTDSTAVVGDGPGRFVGADRCGFYEIEVYDGVAVEHGRIVALCVGLEQSRVGIDIHAVVVVGDMLGREYNLLAFLV